MIAYRSFAKSCDGTGWWDKDRFYDSVKKTANAIIRSITVEVKIYTFKRSIDKKSLTH